MTDSANQGLFAAHRVSQRSVRCESGMGRYNGFRELSQEPAIVMAPAR